MSKSIKRRFWSNSKSLNEVMYLEVNWCRYFAVHGVSGAENIVILMLCFALWKVGRAAKTSELYSLSECAIIKQKSNVESLEVLAHDLQACAWSSYDNCHKGQLWSPRAWQRLDTRFYDWSALTTTSTSIFISLCSFPTTTIISTRIVLCYYNTVHCT